MQISKLAAILVSAFPLVAQASPAAGPDKARYRPHVKDKALKTIEERNEAADKAEEEATAGIRKRQKKEKDDKEAGRMDLITDLSRELVPGTVEEFKAPFHFTPQAQFMTGTCWSFAGTSFLETEIQRIKGLRIKMSEMFTVYWEYVEKARRFVWKRGESAFGQGSQINSVTRMWKMHGAVPLQDYPGVLSEDGWHDHTRMYRRMNEYLKHVKAGDLWDEDLVVANIREIMDHHIGRPPDHIEYEGRTYSPRSFVADVLGIAPDAYVQFMSTTREPMYQTALFDVPDNWWRDKTYHNVPLDDFYGVVTRAVDSGFTSAIGGDVSEPGKNPEQDVAFVPSFDIPADLIDQDSREYRIHNRSTGDDHGIHLLGRANVAGRDWYLIKDSGRSARRGRHHGYYFFREDFIRLKMLTVMVHRDAARELLNRFKSR